MGKRYTRGISCLKGNFELSVRHLPQDTDDRVQYMYYPWLHVHCMPVPVRLREGEGGLCGQPPKEPKTLVHWKNDPPTGARTYRRGP